MKNDQLNGYPFDKYGWPSTMLNSNLISIGELAANLKDPGWTIVDCRFSLDDVDAGRKEYEKAHIPGAVYAHLDEDLSGEIITGTTGRHPLPDPDDFAAVLGRWGIGTDTRVVAYDDAAGAYASRLWWMLHWLGHEAAALLDGGWSLWESLPLPVVQGVEVRQENVFQPDVKWHMVADIEEVEKARLSDGAQLIDSRSEDRYHGENETVDPVAGHIPGAICLPYQDNVNDAGFFLSKDELAARFEGVLKDIPAKEAIFYCGSGVSAAHNLVAMIEAGFPMGKLYVGSWSEWIADPRRPVETT